jgi:hypothetical protein
MSGPVPSPSMKGMTGLSGTLSLPEAMVMGDPKVGVGLEAGTADSLGWLADGSPWMGSGRRGNGS